MGKKKSERGRPPKKPGEKLDAKFLLKLRSVEKAAYEANAGKAGVSLTTWIRRTLNRARR